MLARNPPTKLFLAKDARFALLGGGGGWGCHYTIQTLAYDPLHFFHVRLLTF